MKEKTYRLIMIIGLYLGIILFIISIIALAKNIEEIKTDPIIYGMEKHNFPNCICYNTKGVAINIKTPNYKDIEIINYKELD